MGNEQPASYYDKVYAGKIPGKGQQYQQPYTESQYYPLWQKVIARVETNYVVDLGCGVGHFAEVCAEKNIPFYSGIDFSPVAIEKARQRALPDFYSFRCANILHLGKMMWNQEFMLFPNMTVTILEVLEHIVKDTLLFRILPSGSPIIATVPLFDCDTHVRHFTNAESVKQRYGDLVDIQHLERYKSWYFFKGVTR